MVGGDTVGPIGDGFEAVVPVVGVSDLAIIGISQFNQTPVLVPLVFDGVACCIRIGLHPSHVVEGAGEDGGAFGDGEGVVAVIVIKRNRSHVVRLRHDSPHVVMGEGCRLGGGFHDAGSFADVVVVCAIRIRDSISAINRGLSKHNGITSLGIRPQSITSDPS